MSLPFLIRLWLYYNNYAKDPSIIRKEAMKTDVGEIRKKGEKKSPCKTSLAAAIFKKMVVLQGQ